MTNVIVDVESDGPCPGQGSMISFGAVILDNDLDKTFYAELKPITHVYNSENLAVGGFERHDTLQFPEPILAMNDFALWLDKNCAKRKVFWADNNGFDWQWINYYFHNYYGGNPFGFSSQNINSLYKGLTKDCFASFKHLRKTKHTHNPVDDAMGNAEALLEMRKMGIKIPMK